MNVPEYMAGQTERIAFGLAHFIATTPEDKLDWTPKVEGSTPLRSVLQQVAECVEVNRLIARVLSGGGAAPPPGNAENLTFANGEEAQKELIASAAELAAAIRGLSEDDLKRPFHHPRGQLLGENLIIACFRNMAYHAGQVNFIQMLCGDPEFHVPSNWR